MFLLALTETTREGRRVPLHSVARALRRVGADGAVLLDCQKGSASRIRRESRFDHMLHVPHTDHPVALLSNSRIHPTTGGAPGWLRCEADLGGGNLALEASGRPEVTILEIILAAPDGRVVIAGRFEENLNEVRTTLALSEAAYQDTTEVTGRERSERHLGIVTSGLRTYGEGCYEDPDGAVVHWARLGY